MAIFLNGFLLWDIAKSFQIETWIVKHSSKVEQWFEVVTFFDAYNSLGNFAFNHPKFNYPAIQEKAAAVLKTSKFYHVRNTRSMGYKLDTHSEKETTSIC